MAVISSNPTIPIGDANAELFLVPAPAFLNWRGRCWMVQHPAQVHHEHLYRVVPPIYSATRHGTPGFYIEDTVTGARLLVLLD